MVIVVGQSSSIAKRVTCDNCGAVLEYYKKDVRERHGKDWSGGPDGEKWIVCPSCSKKVILENW